MIAFVVPFVPWSHCYKENLGNNWKVALTSMIGKLYMHFERRGLLGIVSKVLSGADHVSLIWLTAGR